MDGIEHFTGLTADGVDVPDPVLDQVAAADIVVEPTLGFDKEGLAAMPAPPTGLAESLCRAGFDFATAYAARLQVLARAHARGVRIVSGSDAGVGPLKRHGCVVMAAIDLLGAGLSTEQALATATSSAAVARGIEHHTGRLAQGLAADLLAVDGDLRPTWNDCEARPLFSSAATTCWLDRSLTTDRAPPTTSAHDRPLTPPPRACLC